MIGVLLAYEVIKLLLLSTCLSHNILTAYSDTIGACTIFNKNPNTPLSASGHHVCATFSLPPINGAIIAIDTGNTTKKMIAELSKPERTVKRIDLGEVTNLFISPTEPSFSSLRVPAGMGM